MLPLRGHSLLGLTKSLCPSCLDTVEAKIIERGGRVYFRKRCPKCGPRDDFVCSDVTWYDRLEYVTPGKIPKIHAIEPKEGCPRDCGLCTDHEQHTCIGIVELTDSCNLKCPMCYAGSAPGLKHHSVDDCKRAIDRLVEVEGRPEVVQLSGGEPTVHPQFREIYDYACQQPIDYVMINTNGLNFVRDPSLVEYVAERKKRTEVYFQFDSFKESATLELRGAKLVTEKLKAIDALCDADIHIILVCTLQPGLNDDEIGKLVDFGLQRPCITGISFQPATYSGRNFTPEVLENRITFPDVISKVCEQTSEGTVFTPQDFMPLPCAHPNCHQLTYAYRKGGQVTPLPRFIDAKENLDLLANGITFTRPRVRALVERFLSRMGQGCCAGGDCETEEANVREIAGDANGLSILESSIPSFASSPALQGDGFIASNARKFFAAGLAETLTPKDVFRITITNFLDAYNFDVRRLMKCCTHHVLPSGHVVPFCAYNTLYRNGHIPLPALNQEDAMLI
ncbi:radical SAM protein [Stratiformator vulcanicus]|uniref:Antilisterial bacteriocin subtilosin biosynthesis protein AlbA n=1 Tax=Stratiformator vulcanicus TaxID=2527980 RepID=A0A517R7I2_9PLAN|nr:radical SAM protein [Stratiformator vulcanicus]QDT39822.1 Antilisterial bacteriocin subtilosin biosynthesis protein AlbA [Stratiformator vulcanicus]